MTHRILKASLAVCFIWLVVVWPVQAADGLLQDAIDQLSSRQRFELRAEHMEQQREAADARLVRIKKELAGLEDHDWAGCYSTGGGLSGLLLYVAPVSGVVFRHWSDIGDHDLNHGGVAAVKPDRLVFDLAIDERLGDRKFFSSEMVIVPWGGRRFLVSPAGMMEFCNEFNSGMLDTKHGPFVMERESVTGSDRVVTSLGSVERPAARFPRLPKEYRGMLLDAPITARLVDVGDRETGPMPQGMKMTWVRVEARADVGTSAGVFECMKFQVVRPRCFHTATVIDATDDTCTVRFRDWVFNHQVGVQPKVGWVLSTHHWVYETWPDTPPADQAPKPTTRPTTQPSLDDPNPPAPGFDADGSDDKAIEIADAVMEKMGGRRAWDRTRYLTWSFFGRRHHVWDKHAGRVRVERREPGSDHPRILIIDLNTGTGRAWREGEEVTAPDELGGMIEAGVDEWINDSYWLVMPYKLKDAGVTLRSLGPGETQDGRAADVLELTFSEVGRTPQNKYHVWVAADSGLIEQWAYFADAADAEPGFVCPWRDWKHYGRIMLSGDRGELGGKPASLTGIAIFDELPESVFSSAEPVDWARLEDRGRAE